MRLGDLVGKLCEVDVGRAQRRIKRNGRRRSWRMTPTQGSEAALENLGRLVRRPPNMRRGEDRVLDERRRRGRPGEFQRGALVQSKVGALCDSGHYRLAHRKSWLGEAQREIHALDDRGTKSMNVFGNPDRRSGRRLEQ